MDCDKTAETNAARADLSQKLKLIKELDPPPEIKERVLQKIAGKGAQPFPLLFPRVLFASASLAFAIMLLVFFAAANNTRQAHAKEANKYLLKISQYIKSEDSWANVSNGFGNFGEY